MLIFSAVGSINLLLIGLVLKLSLGSDLHAGQHEFKQYHYNQVEHVAFPSYQEFYQSYFTNLVNGRETANTNIVLGVATPECAALLETCAAFIGVQRMAAHDVLHAVSIPADAFPVEMNHCAEVYFIPMGKTIDEYADRTTDLDNREFTRWSRQITSISVKFINEFEFPVALSYVSESQKPVPQSVIEPGASTTINSYLGHMFTARQLTDRTAFPKDISSMPMVDYIMIGSNEYRFHPRNRLETCEVIKASEFLDNRTVGCDDMNLRFEHYSMSHWYSKRLGLNFVQPKLVQRASISKNGFELRKMPRQVYNWLRKWYTTEQLLSEVGEGSSGPCMNQLVAPSQITHLPGNLKDRLAADLQPIVQEWYRGTADLRLTSIYGVRYGHCRR